MGEGKQRSHHKVRLVLWGGASLERRADARDAGRAWGGELVQGWAAGTETPSTPCRPDCHPSPRGLEPVAKEPSAQLVLTRFPGENRCRNKSKWETSKKPGALPASSCPPSCPPPLVPGLQRSLELQARCVPAPPRTGTRAHMGQTSPCPRDHLESWAGWPVSQIQIRLPQWGVPLPPGSLPSRPQDGAGVRHGHT